MAGSRTCHIVLLYCSMLSFCGITIASTIAKWHTTNISSNISWSIAHNETFVASVSIVNQDAGKEACFPNSWNMLMKQKMIFVPKGKYTQVEVSNCYSLTSDAEFSDVDSVSAKCRNIYFGKCLYGCFTTDIH